MKTLCCLILLSSLPAQAQSKLSDKIQSEVSGTSVGNCHVRLLRSDLSLTPFEGPVLDKEACYRYGQALLSESDPSYKMVIVKHNGVFKNFEREFGSR